MRRPVMPTTLTFKTWSAALMSGSIVERHKSLLWREKKSLELSVRPDDMTSKMMSRAVHDYFACGRSQAGSPC